MHPHVAIIVLNWKKSADTLRCIESLERQDYPSFRILVIDNGSADGSVAALQALGDRIDLIESASNLGYTGGNNLAMHTAFEQGADYVWLFNNDAAAEPDTLSRLVARCEAEPDIGLASPLIRESHGHGAVQFACGLFDLSAPAYNPCFDVTEGRTWQERHPERVALVGTALLIRRAVFDRIGGLDDRIFAYWEDIDYSIRSAQAGFRNVMIPDTSVYHAAKCAVTEPDTIRPYYYYFMTRNEMLMWRKFCSFRRILKANYWTLCRQLRQIRRMPDYTLGLDAVLAGLKDGVLGRGGSYNPDRRMPEPLRSLLLHYPGVWLSLLGANVAK